MPSSDIGVKNDIYDNLAERKGEGQSFTDIIWELVYKAEKVESESVAEK